MLDINLSVPYSYTKFINLDGSVGADDASRLFTVIDNSAVAGADEKNLRIRGFAISNEAASTLTYEIYINDEYVRASSVLAGGLTDIMATVLGAASSVDAGGNYTRIYPADLKVVVKITSATNPHKASIEFLANYEPLT